MFSTRRLHSSWCSERATGRTSVVYAGQGTKRAFLGNPETQMRK